MPAYSDAQVATARESWTFWRSKLAAPVHAAALLGCEDGETSFLWKAVGDHGEAHGIFQWHEGRIADIKAHTGIDINTADHRGMLEAAFAEMSQKWPGNIYSSVWPHLMTTTTVTDAETVLVSQYERSASQARDIARRTGLANYWLQQATDGQWDAGLATS